jgi:hypothetical protein
MHAESGSLCLFDHGGRMHSILPPPKVDLDQDAGSLSSLG